MNNYFDYVGDLIQAHYIREEFPKEDDFFLHTHESYEIYCFLGGKGCFKVEGNTYKLHVGDIIIMRPGEAHYIDIDMNEAYTRFSIHFNFDIFNSFDFKEELLAPFVKREFGQHNLYRPSDFKNDTHKAFLDNICSHTENRNLQIVSNLLPFLNEIQIAFKSKDTTNYKETRIQKIIGYINNRLCEKIVIKDICDEFFISYPQLCRIFKSATGSTIGDYITKKRLTMAQGLINQGEKPSKIFSECGFKDYSTFYRAYKKHFGTIPKHS